MSLILLGGASIISMGAACAGNVVSTAPASGGPQIMLYLSQSLWGGGSSSLPRFGLRIGTLRSPATRAQLTVEPPMQRELIDLQFFAHSDVRLEFGKRVVWNITRGAFGPRSSQAVLATRVPIKSIRLSDAVRQPLWNPAASAAIAVEGKSVPRPQFDADRPAVVDMAAPSRWTLTDGLAADMQLRPTIQPVNTRTAEAGLMPRSPRVRTPLSP
jgi:hypothetical protein